jgi:5'-nucleotidase
MKILVTNDDGYDAPGLAVLAEAASEYGLVYIVAPRTNCSGSSHSLSLKNPVDIECITDHYFVVDGTPTDCARLAYSGWLGFEPDWIVSGINRGPNLSDDVLYSGTVAAALEGRFLEHVPLAFSLAGEGDLDYSASRKVVSRIMSIMIDARLPVGAAFNINIPPIPFHNIEGLVTTCLADRMGVNRPISPVKIKAGQRMCTKIPVPPPDKVLTDGTDLHAVAHGFISLTPIFKYELSTQSFVQKVQDLVEKY